MTEPDRPPPPLDYRPPAADRRDRPGMPFWGQMALGFVAFVVSIPVAVWGGGAVAGFTGTSGALFGALPWAVLTEGVLLFVTVYAWERWRWRGFAAGVLAGVGLLVLAVGACFVAVLSDGPSTRPGG